MARVFVVASKRGEGCVIEWICDSQQKAQAYIDEVQSSENKREWIEYNEWEVQ
jgi:hypothetical protein